MVKRFSNYKLVLTFALTSACQSVWAAGFQVWEQDAASVGQYHAGRAVVDDASSAYYNPADLILVQNQQVVAGGAAILTDIRFRGTEAVSTLSNPGPQSVSAQGGTYKFIPFVQYAAPISDKVAFGLSFIEPFALNTNYGSSTNLRYATRLNQIDVYDISPSLGIAFTEKLSWGIGLDMQRLVGEFDRTVAGLGGNDTLSNNSGHDYAFGYYMGLLYQISPETRIGLSYHSKIVHQLTGSSTFIGPLALGGGQSSPNMYGRITLPPTTNLSVFHTLNKQWDLMGTISYTQWSTSNNLILHNVVGTTGGVQNNNLQWTIYQGYRNTWNYALGANYHVNDKFIVRTGAGYDEAPTTDSKRSIQLPDSNKVAIALGAHYQATKTLGFDLGWTHLFMLNSRINNVSQATGDQIVITNGSVQQNADVYAAQLKWDIL
jgi:long-chain fatty acid transport protein